MTTFTPERLTLARRRRGLTKTELATRADLGLRIITEYEAGRRAPSDDALARLGNALSFPTEFFCAPPLAVPNENSVSFRSLKSLTASQRDAAVAACSIGFTLNDWIEQKFTLRSPNLPDLRGMRPEEAAIATRDHWGIGLQPIPSVVHLLELHGVRVFSLSEQSRSLDAISMWHGGRAFCFLNTMKSAEHSRFDAAHEAAHLILHRHGEPNGRVAEQEADAFASAFLMPREIVRSRVPRGATRNDLLRVKQQLRVSLAALTYRSHSVGLLSDWQYRSLCIEMSRNGERIREPVPLPNRETSQVLQKVFSALREDGVSKTEIARQLHVHVDDVDALVFGLVVTSLEGGGGGSTTNPQPTLRLVKG